MRKLVFFIFPVIILFYILSVTMVSEQTVSEDNYQVIPDEAIRLRILAHSDEKEDQRIKHLVRDEVNEHISSWVEHIADINEARQLIRKRIPKIQRLAENVLTTDGNSQGVDVAYGSNVTFPVKLYDSYVYPAGEYEAVLITIGEGKGANWWCVLFPPLCFLDFSNGTTVADSDNTEEDDDLIAGTDGDEKPVKIKFFLFEWFGWT